MARDIIVTTPKNESENAAKEAQDAKDGKVKYYFRCFSRKPDVNIGSRIFYTDLGFVTGYSVVSSVSNAPRERCQTTGKLWDLNYVVYCPVESWNFISPIPMKGFQGFLYADDNFLQQVKVIGDWKMEFPPKGA